MEGDQGSDQHALASPAIPDRVYFRIGDVADLVGVKPYVLRYWESEFPLIQPEKSNTGQRVYRKSDVESLLMIKHLLYSERYSIEGARKRIRELRKSGEWKDFKETRLHGDSAHKKERVKQTLETARELNALARQSIRELFKF